MDLDFNPIVFHLDSRLIVFAGQVNDQGEKATFFMDFDGKTFRQVYRVIDKGVPEPKVEATISGMIEGDGDWGPGVLQLIDDIIEKMEKCVAAFKSVHKLREAKADKNAQQAA